MKLTDIEILQIHELCNALVDERLAESQQAQLSQWLDTSEQAREIYFRVMSLSASLAEYASEMQTDSACKPEPQIIPFHRKRSFRLMTAALAAAACVAWGLFILYRPATGLPRQEDLADSEPQSGGFVARVSGAQHCVWKGTAKFQPGDALQRGQMLELLEGIAEITFDCGAQVILQGPAALDVVSAWEATLDSGGLKATVPPQAIGFRVHHKSVEVVDLGTEFSMVADAGGDAEVHVLKGAIEVSPAGEEEVSPSVMRENESRRFGKNRKTARKDFANRQLRLAQPAPLERWKRRVNFAHWTFDDIKEGILKAETVGLRGSFDANSASAPLSEGRWNHALHFDGQGMITAAAPALSKSSSRAVAFWVRVPENAQLSDSHAMVAWPMQSKKYGNRPLEIGWNRNPNQGPIGALRTELGKIYAMGATPLRDGHWHHVAVVFQPISAGDGPVQITQYVDGRLEGSTIRALKIKHLVSDADASLDILWLGSTPSKHSKRHFRGDIDELFVTDRALSQPEIVSLMTQNHLPRVDLSFNN